MKKKKRLVWTNPMFCVTSPQIIRPAGRFFFLVDVPKLPRLELGGLRLRFSSVCLCGLERKMSTSNVGLFVVLSCSLMCKLRENRSFDNDVAMNRPTTRFHAIENNVNMSFEWRRMQ